jgi:hypothetical protein
MTNVINLAARHKLIREAEKAREKREAERGADGLTDRQRACLAGQKAVQAVSCICGSHETCVGLPDCAYPAGAIEIPKK